MMKKTSFAALLAVLFLAGCQQNVSPSSVTQNVTPALKTQQVSATLEIQPSGAMNESIMPVETSITQTDQPLIASGTIDGSMGYPAETIPPSIIVCADNTSTKATFCTSERINSDQYTSHVGYQLTVPAGNYNVYEKISEGTIGSFDSTYKAYYSDFVVCGEKNTCTSHNPVAVQVQAGQTTSGISPTDWYNL